MIISITSVDKIVSVHVAIEYSLSMYMQVNNLILTNLKLNSPTYAGQLELGLNLTIYVTEKSIIIH